MKKLRASAKQGLSDDAPSGEPEKPGSQQQAKKEDAKKADPKKPDPKDAKKDPKAKKDAPGEKAAENYEDKGSDEGDIKCSQKELDLTQHIFVNMLL